MLALTARLRALPKLAQPEYGGADHAAEITAHAVADIMESASRLVVKVLPTLLDAATSDELEDALIDVADELRHIVYHAKDAKYFAFIFDDRERL